MMRTCTGALLAALAVAAPAQAVPDPAPFTNLNGTFRVDLPAGWRQIAPNEALRIAEIAGAPRDLRTAQPRAQYAVGPVDAWLAGDFASPWLFVTEIAEEAAIPEDFGAELARMWQRHGEGTRVRHELRDVRREDVGERRHPAITCRRTSVPQDGSRATASLDVYAGTGRQQVTLAFTCWADELDRHEAAFRAALRTLAFARPPRTAQQPSDRLWTPLVTGALVGVVLIVLYRRMRRGR